MTESDGTDAAAADGVPPDAPAEGRAKDETAWQRRKRLAAVFGDVLPETTSDDRGPEPGKGDDWYRSQVPPHHG